MIVCAAIVSQAGDQFCPSQLPYQLRVEITKHAENFLILKQEFKKDDVEKKDIYEDEFEQPFIETKRLRYVFKQTGDIYWILVTKIDSSLDSDIHFLGRFVCTIMEYGFSDLNSTTLTEEQRDLFYRHILRPWDEGDLCPLCGCHYGSPEVWEREFESRLQFLISIRDGNMIEEDVKYFNKLIAESWSISARLSPKWETENDSSFLDSESETSETLDQSISEMTLIEGCRLKCRLEDIRIESVRIQDPYLRLFAKRNLLNEENEFLVNNEQD